MYRAYLIIYTLLLFQLPYMRKLKYIYTVYLFHNCKKSVFQLGNRIHLTGK